MRYTQTEQPPAVEAAPAVVEPAKDDDSAKVEDATEEAQPAVDPETATEATKPAEGHPVPVEAAAPTPATALHQDGPAFLTAFGD